MASLTDERTFIRSIDVKKLDGKINKTKEHETAQNVKTLLIAHNKVKTVMIMSCGIDGIENLDNTQTRYYGHHKHRKINDLCFT